MKTPVAPYTMCSAAQKFDQHRATVLPSSAAAAAATATRAETAQNGTQQQHGTAARGFNVQPSPPPPPPPPSYTSCKRPADRRVSTQTLILALFILLSLFSCVMTVALSYKTQAAHEETGRQIDEVIRDLKHFADIVREELMVKRVNLENDYRAQQQRQKQLQELREAAKDDAADYEDRPLDDEESDDNRFMGVDLDENRWPKNRGGDQRPAADAESSRRRRRSAVIDVTRVARNELNRFTPEVVTPVVPLLLTKTLDVVDAHLKTKYSRMFTDVVNSFTSSAKEKSNVEMIEGESNEENTVPTHYSYHRQERNMGAVKKIPPGMEQHQQTGEDKEKMREDFKNTQQLAAAAAHFASDSSKYNIRTHSHYQGNGRIKHPDGDYKDWSQHVWSGISNVNHFQLKNGKVEISTAGVYFVYAQLYYSDQHDVNGYFVMKNEEKVLGCTTTRHQETQSDSCYTAGLIYFDAKDILSIRGIDMERYIILDPIRSFFGLFEVAKHFK